MGGGGKSRTANSDRALVLGVGGSRKTKSFFPDSGSDRDSDKTFQISRNLGHEHVEFFCLLDSQPCPVQYLPDSCMLGVHILLQKDM